MKQADKLLAFLLCIVMFCCVSGAIVVIGAANDLEPNIYVNCSHPEVQIGDTFTVTIAVKAVKVSSLTDGIAFDPEMLECVHVEGIDSQEIGLWTEDREWVGVTVASDAALANANGTVGFAWAGSQERNYSEQAYANVTFRALAEGETTISIYEDSAGSGGVKYPGDNNAEPAITVAIRDHIHNHIATVYEPDCITGGYTQYECSCGERYIADNTDALGHDFGSWYVVKEATTETEGEEKRDCSRCEAYETRSIPKQEPGRYCISGTVTSYGLGTDEVTVWLLNAEGETVYSTTVNGNTTEYTFTSVSAGTYTLQISKPNHITRSYTVVVEGSDVIQDAKILLRGDVTGDGKVTATDYSRLLAHVKKVNVITDPYMLLCADVTGEGRVTATDYSRLLAHVKKVAPLW